MSYLDSIENFQIGLESIKENWLAKNPYDPRFGDMHFYDYKMNGWEANSFPIPRFMSEYGVQVKYLDIYLVISLFKIYFLIIKK